MGKSKCCDKQGLKKGPWTHEEDKILLSFIEKHGCGSWRALPAKAGLQRCGKSCRLRWINYLRPDIKRGKFSLQEERTIIHLHALLGNRLTKMGIDPMTHKPNGVGSSKYVANLSHMAEWEIARLEAEARLVRTSKILFNNNNIKTSHNYNINNNHSSSSTFQQLPYHQLPCLDILKAWQMASTKLPTINDISAILLNNSRNKDLESSIPSTLNSSENLFMNNNVPTAATKVGNDHQNLPHLSTINSCFEDDQLQTELPTFMQEFSGLFPEHTHISTNGTVDNFMGSCFGDFEDSKLINWNNIPSYLVTSPIGSPVF
ncbi:unnamed protein product [Withania somnifera]